MSKCTSCGGLGYYDEGHENDDGTMSGGCYVECRACTKSMPTTCTSDEWLANATQSTRDLANKIKGNQFRNQSELELREIEISEFKSALRQANSQTEEFERKWYLEKDKVEALIDALGCARPWIVTDRNTFFNSAKVRNGSDLINSDDQIILDGYDSVIEIIDEAFEKATSKLSPAVISK